MHDTYQQRLFCHSEESASHGRHIGCDCVMLPGVPGKTKVDGYDEGGMRDRWARCQKAAGVKDGDTWKSRKKTLKEAATRDREWLLTGACKATRIAANPKAANKKTTNPDAYADWQDAVSRVKTLVNHPNVKMHCEGTKPFDNVKKNSNRILSYYRVPGNGDNEKERALQSEIDRLAGTGWPVVTSAGKWRKHEIVNGVIYAGFDESAGGAETHRAKIHYATGKDARIHMVPCKERTLWRHG